MITFSELYSDINELKRVNLAQRRKQARRMAKITKTAAFKRKVELSKRKVASPEKIKVKAAKLAKKKVLDKFYPQYKNMAVQQRVKIDQIVAAKYGGMINKIAQRSAKVVKKKELLKVKQYRLRKKEDA